MSTRSVPWRVAVTRDEDPDGPLSRALRHLGFEPLLCPVAIEAAPADPQALSDAARHLERYDWVVFASQRAVRAVVAARNAPWPRGLRTAAVGSKTAAALREAGADPAPLTAAGPGADALWNALASEDTWPERRVLVPAVSGGRPDVIEGLTRAGAHVTIVEPYRMIPRPAEVVAADWRGMSPDAAVIASPSAASLLAGALGSEALGALRAVVAIGTTTAAALNALGVRHQVAPAADFASAAAALGAIRRAASSPEATNVDG